MQHCMLSLVLAAGVIGDNIPIAHVPYQYTYMLPRSFNSTFDDTSWLNSTNLTCHLIESVLRNAGRARFVSYSAEFSSMIGMPSEPTVIKCPSISPQCAFEAAIWLPDVGEVWTTVSTFATPDGPAFSRFFLGNNTVQSFYVPNLGMSGFNGGTYFDQKVWLGGLQAPASQAAIASIDPVTLNGTVLINSYLGLPFSGADDLAWVKRGNDAYLFFTALNFDAFAIPRLSNPLPLPNAVWRWDPQEEVPRPVIDRTQINIPNGIRASPDQRTLYVTDTLNLNQTSGSTGGNYTATNAVYAFDLDDEALPGPKKMFSLTRTGVADGIHVDDKGRVWTGEGDGIVVRSSKGKILGQVNTADIPRPDTKHAVAQFSLAGDKLVILAFDHVMIFQLNETLIAVDSTVAD